MIMTDHVPNRNMSFMPIVCIVSVHTASDKHLQPYSKDYGWKVWKYHTKEYIEYVNTLVEECVVPELASEISDRIYAECDSIKVKLVVWLDGIGKNQVSLIALAAYHHERDDIFITERGKSSPHAIMFVPQNEQTCRPHYHMVMTQLDSMHGKVFKHKNSNGDELDIEFDVNGLVNQADRAAMSVNSGKPSSGSGAREGFQVCFVRKLILWTMHCTADTMIQEYSSDTLYHSVLYFSEPKFLHAQFHERFERSTLDPDSMLHSTSEKN